MMNEAKRGEHIRPVLLIHGFTGVPDDMLPAAETLEECGFETCIPRLKGHQRSKAEMAGNTYQDWIDSALTEYDRMVSEGKSPIVLGYSMGALIAIMIAVTRKLDEVILVSAPVFALSVKGIIKRVCCSPFYTLHSYLQLPKNAPRSAIHEFDLLREKSREAVSEMTSRVTIIHAKDDDCANPKSAKYILEHSPSKEKRMIWLKTGFHEVFNRSGKILPETLKAVREAAELYDRGCPEGQPETTA